MLSVSLATAGIYFAASATSNRHLLFGIMISSFGLAAVSVAVGIAIGDDQPATATTPGSSITMGGSSYGPQIAGNSGNIHIGDLHNTAVPAPERARDFRDEWLALAEKMQKSCSPFLRADWSMNNILGESWRVPGGPEKNICQAWLRQAGAMLLVSPRVREQLPKSVAEDPNDLNRWLRYLKERYTFEYRGFGHGQTDDGEVETVQLGTIPDLAGQSHKACIDCSTIEMLRESANRSR